MVVQQSCKKIVRGCDCVEISRKMQIQVLHGNHLRITASCRSALDAEARAERGLTKRNDCLLSELSERLSQTDAGSRLSFTGRCRVDRRDEDQPAVRSVL